MGVKCALHSANLRTSDGNSDDARWAVAFYHRIKYAARYVIPVQPKSMAR